MPTDIMTEFEQIATNEENNGGVSLYAVQETLRDDLKWKGYDYKQTLISNSVSPYLLRNLRMSNFLKYLNDIAVEYVETVKKIRVYYNFTVDKDYRNIN
jgi:FMN phosphatase YigB (HAD superfamily)